MVSLSSWRAWIEICDSLRRAHVWKSLSSWRAWIEMKTGRMPPTPATCRSPHGERGLKYDSHGAAQDHRRSLSSWRAWIEIRRTIPSSNRPTSRSPHGERGLKSVSASFRPPRGCCSPCLCPVFPAHAGFHMCGTASNGKPGFLSARGDFNGNTSRNCDWVFRMGSLLKAM